MPSSKSPVTLSGQGKQLGSVQGGQSPITDATIQLWQVNFAVDGGPGTAMLSDKVTTSDGSGSATNSNANAGNLNNTLPAGSFTIANAYTCPPGDALVYITASGGNPGLSAGTNNPQSQMVTALGSCNNLKNNVQFININEQTTVATVAALFTFMSSYNAIGASPAHAADLPAAFAKMNEYVDFQAGVAPGPALPAGYSASTGDLNLLANVLATCVNSAGGTLGDGSPCGTLFDNTSASTSNPSTDITAAALFLRENYYSSLSSIASLPTPQAPFLPETTTVPLDWKLPIFELPSTPTFSLSPGTYSGVQQVSIQEADPSAVVYYSFGGVPPAIAGQSYTGVITVGDSETINAVAVAAGGRATSSVVSAAYTITGVPNNVPTVSIDVESDVNVGSTAVVNMFVRSPDVDGSVVTFATAGGLGGSFSPATCTVSGGYCSTTYTPSGNAPAGTYTNDIIASFSASGGYSATTVAGTFYIVGPVTLTNLAPGDFDTNSLIQASDGNFYGVDPGLIVGFGQVFRMDSSGNVTPVYNFTGGSNGALPWDRLVQGSDGSFYGVTYSGGSGSSAIPVSLGGGASGNGTVFKVDALGNFTLLYSFTGTNDGANPESALVQGTDGSFYGVAPFGGASTFGTAFKVDASGNFTLLHAFAGGADGAVPAGSLLQGADGNFYGTTSAGGTYNLGTIYKMDASGNVNTLYSFTGGADGDAPNGGLAQGTDGSFYGSTVLAGTYGCGTLFKIDSSGNFTVLYGFMGSEDGSEPVGVLVQAADGDFYGLASHSGSLFKVDASGNFTLLHFFTDGTDGSLPGYSLVQGSDGSFYGATSIAGPSGPDGPGTLFKLTPSPALAGPVTLSVPATVTHGSSFTLTYTVVNASSKTMQQCFATNGAGDTAGWTGVKTASTSAKNVTLTAPATAGAYSYALTCGGVESGFVTLNVN